MSLSGLDSQAIEAAVRTVSQERGGWYVLQLPFAHARVYSSYVANVAEWVDVCIFPIVQQVIARASNRVIVGLPRCKCSLPPIISALPCAPLTATL